jgi:hypothetical protein
MADVTVELGSFTGLTLMTRCWGVWMRTRWMGLLRLRRSRRVL